MRGWGLGIRLRHSVALLGCQLPKKYEKYLKYVHIVQWHSHTRVYTRVYGVISPAELSECLGKTILIVIKDHVKATLVITALD